MPELSIRTMAQEELDLDFRWAADEGWNPGIRDAACFRAADPGGFFIGELNGEPAASISAVAYDSEFGFLGFYIVRPEHRGEGYGLRMWEAGMRRLGNRTVGLDGVLAQQANYERSGFTLKYRNVRHEGIGGGTRPGGIIDISTVPFEAVARYDRGMFPSPRPALLSCWLGQPGATSLGILRDGELAGYGVLWA